MTFDKNKKTIFALLATNKTPDLRLIQDLTSDKFELHIQGRCIPENPIEYFNPLINRVTEKVSAIKEQISNDLPFLIHIDLEYINSISIKFFIKLLKNIVDKLDKNVEVYWYYEDEDSLELGMDLEMILDVKFHYLEKEI